MFCFLTTLGLGSLALNLHGDGRNLSGMNIHGRLVESLHLPFLYLQVSGTLPFSLKCGKPNNPVFPLQGPISGC